MQIPYRSLLASLMLAASLGAHAAEPARPSGATIDFSAEASRPAPNDLVVATLYTERGGADPAALARQVNREIAAALETVRAVKDVKGQSAGTSTWPVYGKDGTPAGSKIEGWRMRSEIRLESRNLGAMSELIGELQASLALGHVDMQPALETRRKAVDEATVDALKAFEQRAGLISTAMGKRYRIRQLNISDNNGQRPMFARMRAATMAAEAVPAPLEGGETDISVTVTGSIELTD